MQRDSATPPPILLMVTLYVTLGVWQYKVHTEIGVVLCHEWICVITAAVWTHNCSISTDSLPLPLCSHTSLPTKIANSGVCNDFFLMLLILSCPFIFRNRALKGRWGRASLGALWFGAWPGVWWGTPRLPPSTDLAQRIVFSREEAVMLLSEKACGWWGASRCSLHLPAPCTPAAHTCPPAPCTPAAHTFPPVEWLSVWTFLVQFLQKINLICLYVGVSICVPTFR